MMYQPEGSLLFTPENQATLQNKVLLKDAFFHNRPLEARVILCDNEHNLHLDLGCMRGMIPREEGAIGIADGSVRDIALISRVNKPVVFRITGFRSNSVGATFAMLSRRSVQLSCLEEYISRLQTGQVIDAVVTHLEPYGAFCDIGAGISALLPIDAISFSKIPHPRERFSCGQKIKAIVKSVDAQGRIVLSHKELLGTWMENAAQYHPGDTVPGIVRSIEPYGIFVELTPNLTGLADYAPGAGPDANAIVYIKQIVPERMKIKLILVDSFYADYPPQEIQYYLPDEPLRSWLYSPENCEKHVETRFEQE